MWAWKQDRSTGTADPRRGERDGAEHEAERQSEPEAGHPPAEREAESIANGKAERPVANDIHDHWCTRVADAAKHTRRNRLRAVEQLKGCGDREQACTDVDNARIECECTEHRD